MMTHKGLWLEGKFWLKVDNLQGKGSIHVKRAWPGAYYTLVLTHPSKWMQCIRLNVAFGLWEMEVPLTHEICWTVPQINNEDVAARNNYSLSPISRGAWAAENNTYIVSGRKNTIKGITGLNPKQLILKFLEKFSTFIPCAFALYHYNRHLNVKFRPA